MYNSYLESCVVLENLATDITGLLGGRVGVVDFLLVGVERRLGLVRFTTQRAHDLRVVHVALLMGQIVLFHNGHIIAAFFL